MGRKKQIIIIGGGFAGLNAAKSLRKADADVTIIDRLNHHLFQPLLYQIAAAALSPANIASPLREVLRSQKNAYVVMKDVVSINKEGRKVTASDGTSYDYDYLIVAPGASHAYFGHDEWEKFAPGLKTIEDAITIREKILTAFENAEVCPDPELEKAFMRFVIVGGGPTGVELAGAIAEIATKSLSKDFRHINPAQSEILLIEGCSQVLPSYPKKLADSAHKDLEKLGVKVMTDTFVTDIKENGIYIGEKFIPTATIIWAAGNQASPLLKTLDAALDKQGRVIVGKDLTIPDYPDIFVIGDAAHVLNSKGEILPGIAPVAIQQGRYVAKIILKGSEPLKRKPFSYFDKGMMATIGSGKAVAAMGKIQISGFFAWLAWGLIHIFYLIGFQNRTFVLLHWFYLYLVGTRQVRLITRFENLKDKRQ